jgi:hypothetical protein
MDLKPFVGTQRAANPARKGWPAIRKRVLRGGGVIHSAKRRQRVGGFERRGGSLLERCKQGESFGFLGFEFRRIRSLQGKWRPYYPPKLKQRTALLRKLKEVFRRFVSQPADRVVQLINPILRAWVNYFALGDASRCFSFVKDWVEKKVRRHLMRARNRQGFGWKRWSRRWLYDELRLFNNYRVRRPRLLPKALPVR